MECKNLRDVSTLVPQFPRGVILRGGSVDYLTLNDIGNPRTILNLRKQLDNESQFMQEPSERRPVMIQVAKDKDLESYNVHERDTQKWILSVVKLFESTDTIRYPVLIHCASGKDRTGVIVACLLLICGMDRSVIELDFASSKGLSSEHVTLMKRAIDHMLKKGLPSYFRGVALDKIRHNLLSQSQ